MKSLKNILSFVIPLTAMLITFAIFLFTTKIVDNYKLKISNDYSILIISSSPILEENIDEFASIRVKDIELLKKDHIINNMRNKLSKTSIKLLQRKLPYFYRVYLQQYPTISQLEKIREEISSISGVKKVEIFSKNHNKIFLLLLIMQKIISIVFIIILLYAAIIISKQIKIWFYENQDKISIMRFHGASMLHSASTLIKHGVLGAFISFCIVAILLLLLNNNLTLIFPSELQSVVDIELSIKEELIKIFLLSLFISISTIIGVLFKYKLKND